MRLLVTGSREWDNHATLVDALTDAWMQARGDLTVVHGWCKTGADALADAWADRMGDQVVVERYRAEWEEYGKPAGFIRNAHMVDLGADRCFAFFKIGAANDGTTHCSDLAEKTGIPVTRWWA